MDSTSTPKWHRVRFSCWRGDARPVKWPAPGPSWNTGYDPEDGAVVVAFVRSLDQVREYWPDSGELDFDQPYERVEFYERFPAPDGWDLDLDDWSKRKEAARD
jgi:hypothetical protein